MMNDAGITIYIVLFVALAVWGGIFFYLWRIDTLAQELRRRLDNQQPHEATPPTPRATLERRPPGEQ